MDPNNRDKVLEMYYKHVINNKNLIDAIYN